MDLKLNNDLKLFSFHNYDMNDYLFHFLIILVLNKKSIAWLSFYLLKSNK